MKNAQQKMNVIDAMGYVEEAYKKRRAAKAAIKEYRKAQAESEKAQRDYLNSLKENNYFKKMFGSTDT